MAPRHGYITSEGLAISKKMEDAAHSIADESAQSLLSQNPLPDGRAVCLLKSAQRASWSALGSSGVPIRMGRPAAHSKRHRRLSKLAVTMSWPSGAKT